MLQGFCASTATVAQYRAHAESFLGHATSPPCRRPVGQASGFRRPRNSLKPEFLAALFKLFCRILIFQQKCLNNHAGILGFRKFPRARDLATQSTPVAGPARNTASRARSILEMAHPETFRFRVIFCSSLVCLTGGTSWIRNRGIFFRRSANLRTSVKSLLP